jgi:hypothetical protein
MNDLRRYVLDAGTGLVMFFCAAQCAAAGHSTLAMISEVLHMSNGVVLFSHNGQRSGAPACATLTGRFAIDGSTVGGRVQVAGLLSAVARSKAITVFGTGTCSAWGDTETVNFFQVAD